MKPISRIFITCLLMLTANMSFGQTNTVGLILNDSMASFDGYTLFAPLQSVNTYLVDNEGYLINLWKSSYQPGQAAMLLPDGSLLRTAFVQSGNSFNAGGSGGRIEKYDWNGNLTWYFDYSAADYCSHHDAEYLPNGNILLISWERMSYNEAVASGRDPSTINNNLWSEKIIEVKPEGNSGGTIVWEWHAWDHLIQDYDSDRQNYGTVQQHPELINLNYGRPIEDWLHINSVRYNPNSDEILLSVHNFSEVWIIDHSTTIAEAASHSGGKKGKGGDLLYRWGNPQAYNSGNASDQIFLNQHDARWIDSNYAGSGDITVFNNGQGRAGGNYSSVDEFTPQLETDGNYFLDSNGRFGPEKLSWTYQADPPSSFYAMNISGAFRLPNGNTFITEGTAGKFFEVDASGKIVWEYINPVARSGAIQQGGNASGNIVFKAYKYAPDSPGLQAKDLSRKGRIESYPTGIEQSENMPAGFKLEQNYPNPFNPETTIKFSFPSNVVETPHGASLPMVTLKIYDVLGRDVATLVNGEEQPGSYSVMFNAGSLSSGTYIYRLTAGNYSATRTMILLK